MQSIININLSGAVYYEHNRQTIQVNEEVRTMKQEAFAHVSKNGGLNQNQFIMASHDILSLDNIDVTAQTIQPTPAAGFNKTM